MKVAEKPRLCPIHRSDPVDLPDWQARFQESRAAGARVDAYWQQTDEERRMGFARLREVCTYDPVDDEIERHYLREPDPELLAAESQAYYDRHDPHELVRR